MAGNALLVMRSGITTNDKAVLAVGTVVLGLSAVVAVMGWRRHAQIVIMTRDGRNLVRPGVIRLAALAAATAAVGATIAVLR